MLTNIHTSLQKVARVSVPFTGGHCCGKGKSQTRSWLIIVPLPAGIPHKSYLEIPKIRL
jgi:hypothetical protein